MRTAIQNHTPMHKLCTAILFHLLLFAAAVSVRGAEISAREEAAPYAGATVYLLPIREDIMPATVRQVTRCLEEATALNASCVVIDMNTYGGVLDAADSIRTMLLDYPAPTIAFINNQAASCGSADCPRRRQHLHAPRRKHRSSHGGRRKRRSDARQVSEFHALHDACHGRGARPGSLGRTGRHGVAVAARPANSRGHGEPFDSRSRPY